MSHKLDEYLMITGLCNDTLEHSGVKGMRWGIRKKVESARTTDAKANYEKTKKKLSEVRKKAVKETNYGSANVSPGTTKKLEESILYKKYAKKDVQSSKILDKLERKPKSNYQLKMEDKYKKQGFNDDEAAVAAYKNIRTKKILAATAILAISVAAYKIKQENMDKVLKVGTKMQRISASPDLAVRDAFYAANNKMDKVKYKGLYGDVLNSRRGGAYQKDLEIVKAIKQASTRNARKTLSDLYKQDPQFAESLRKYMEKGTWLSGDKYQKISDKARKSLLRGKIDKNVYELFNASMVDHSPNMEKLTGAYYKKLMSRGYNAIKDVNDSKYSGYNAKNPVIAFGVKNHISVNAARKLSYDEIVKANKKGWRSINTEKFVKAYTPYAVGAAGAKKGYDLAYNKTTAKMINSYKNKHPNTTLSNTEIARVLKRR